MRTATLHRATAETDVKVTLRLEGGEARIRTGLGYFDHMLLQLAKHGGFGLEVEARGDLPVDSHHLVEDVGLCLGDTLKEALGDRAGIVRFAHAYVPLDEALARVVVDLSGRPWCEFHAELPPIVLGDGFQVEMVREFFIALAVRGGLAIHADLLRGVNTHHKVEALFKALARALRQATRTEGGGVPSTKGTLSA
ncbi:imidazoleglycerol-phosphate dehydratase [Geothrix oryzae]|uniref:Imidazoleglycerol-phosphate dehydratase n=1 Tax=Geothrix oryzae TaxID=2927975 RepID=A0ABM8DQD3_9BACT|nr:imidazoleglycerol-phosphate dehydratase HisB [Geothrix oryzae]BDU69161.1 imidazoleglycerol-phosphate dehydratase [Geothrix oryzae]